MSRQELRQAVLNRFISKRARVSITIGPALLWLVGLLLVPLLFLIAVSFTINSEEFQIIWQPTLENYAALLRVEALSYWQDPFFKSLVTSFAVAITTTVLTFLLALPVAYLLARSGGRFFKIAFYFILLPFFTIYLVRAYSWYLMFGEAGFINKILLEFGLVHRELAIVNYGFLAVVVGLVHAYFPYMLFTLFASFDGLDFAIIEAARDLGASRLEVFIDIILPLIAPGIVAGSVFVFVPSLGAFLTPEVLGQGKILMIGQLIESRVLTQFAIGYGSAASMFLIVPVVVVFGIAFRYASFKNL